MKHIPITLKVLAYDDKITPIELIGQKILPILEEDNLKKINESLDICHFLDLYDKKPIIKASSGNVIINKIMNNLSDNAKYKYLTHPRQIFHPMNKADFPTLSAKNYFRDKQEKSLGITFEQAIKNSPIYAKKVESVLNQLEAQLKFKFITSDEFSIDDILFFPILHELTIASDVIRIPENIASYLTHIYQITEIKPYIKFNFQDNQLI
jgi:glutaredoxin 2